eukprot:scaffold14916_cov128-Isochrysis_galbana.AAC.4
MAMCAPTAAPAADPDPTSPHEADMVSRFFGRVRPGAGGGSGEMTLGGDSSCAPSAPTHWTQIEPHGSGSRWLASGGRTAAPSPASTCTPPAPSSVSDARRASLALHPPAFSKPLASNRVTAPAYVSAAVACGVGWAGACAVTLGGDGDCPSGSSASSTILASAAEPSEAEEVMQPPPAASEAELRLRTSSSESDAPPIQRRSACTTRPQCEGLSAAIPGSNVSGSWAAVPHSGEAAILAPSTRGCGSAVSAPASTQSSPQLAPTRGGLAGLPAEAHAPPSASSAANARRSRFARCSFQTARSRRACSQRARANSASVALTRWGQIGQRGPAEGGDGGRRQPHILWISDTEPSSTAERLAAPDPVPSSTAERLAASPVVRGSTSAPMAGTNACTFSSNT